MKNSLILLTLLLPTWLFAQSTSNTSDQLVEQAWEAVNRNYLDRSFSGNDWEKVLKEFKARKYSDATEAHQSITEMLGRLNSPTTRLMTKDQFGAFLSEVSGQEHIGTGLLELLCADIGENARKLQIVTTLPGTPARLVGLLPGDEILAIDNVSTRGVGLTEAMARLRGAEGTKVNLLIGRGGRTQKLSLPRRLIPAVSRSVTAEVRQFRGKKFGYIRLDIFIENSVAQMRQALTYMKQTDIAGLILDLRNNPGGAMQVCLQIASMFDGAKPFGKIKSRDAVTPLETKGEKITDLPTVVLVNKGTASAAELLAGFLQFHNRATVIGEKTFGKGLVHNAISLADGSVILIASGSFQSLKGIDILGNGITPDVFIKSSAQDEQYLSGARILLRAGKASAASRRV